VKDFYYTVVNRTFKGFLTLFYGHRTAGEELLPPGAAIIAPNHASFLDPLLIAASCPEPAYFLARKSLFSHRILGWALPRLHAFPVNAADNLTSFKIILQLLKEGKKVVIFPEGNRTTTGTLGTLMPGVAMLAMRAHCPIIPTRIEGSYKAWPRNRRFPRLFGHTSIAFLSPIYPPDPPYDKKEAQNDLTAKLLDALN